MGTKVRELTPITSARAADPNCATCTRRPDRLYMDDIWKRANARYRATGSASVTIRRNKTVT